MSLIQKIYSDRTKVRTALAIALISARFMSSASFEDVVISENGSFNSMASIAGIIILSSYIQYYTPVSTMAAIFVEVCYFSVLSLVVYSAMLNQMSSTQAMLSVLLGLCISHGLFQRGGFRKAAVTAPILISCGLLLRDSEYLVLNILSTFLIIDGMLDIARQWSDDHQTPFIFVAMCGSLELLSK